MAAAPAAPTWVTLQLSTFILIEMREGESAGKVKDRMMGITARAASQFSKVPVMCTIPLGCDTASGTFISVMGRLLPQR